MFITRAEPQDLPEILELQKLAYQSEAERLSDYSIQPLHQTLEEVEEEFRGGLILKAVEMKTGRIVGSVRGRTGQDTLYIGKLIVDSGCRNRGLGSRLLRELEAHFPGLRCELFTSSSSSRNLAFYHKNGYTPYRRERLNGQDFTYFQKHPRMHHTYDEDHRAIPRRGTDNRRERGADK